MAKKYWFSQKKKNLYLVANVWDDWKKIVQSKNKKASMTPFFVCSLSNCLAYLTYIVVMSPSRAEGFSARLGSWRFSLQLGTENWPKRAEIHFYHTFWKSLNHVPKSYNSIIFNTSLLQKIIKNRSSTQNRISARFGPIFDFELK